jgi:hypothetical protein
MNTDQIDPIYKAESELIIGYAIEAHNRLEFGFRILLCQQQKQFDWDTSSILNSKCWKAEGSDTNKYQWKSVSSVVQTAFLSLQFRQG